MYTSERDIFKTAYPNYNLIINLFLYYVITKTNGINNGLRS